MDWGAYDDYHDPELECGHRANDGCDCSINYCECEEDKEPKQQYCNKCIKEIKEDS